MISNDNWKRKIFISDFVIKVIQQASKFSYHNSEVYAPNSFDEETMERIANWYQKILDGVLKPEFLNKEGINRYSMFYRFLYFLVEDNSQFLQTFIDCDVINYLYQTLDEFSENETVEHEFGFAGFIGLLSLNLKRKNELSLNKPKEIEMKFREAKAKIIKKIFHEKYDNGVCEILSSAISNLCQNDLFVSLFVIELCLKSLLQYTKNDVYYHVLVCEKLLGIDDEFKEIRVCSLLGFPTVSVKRSNIEVLRINSILSVEKNLNSCIFGFPSTFQDNLGLLDLVFKFKRSVTNLTVILIDLLVGVMLKDEKILKYMITIPPKNALNCYYFEWFDSYLREGSSSEPLRNSLYKLTNDENFLRKTQRKIERLKNLIVNKFGEFNEAKGVNKSLENRRLEIIEKQDEDDSETELNSMLTKQYLIGSFTKISDLPIWILNSENYGKLEISLRKYKCAVCLNKANGFTNLAFPNQLISGTQSINLTQTKNEKIQEFFGNYEHKTPYEDEITFEIETEAKVDDLLTEFSSIETDFVMSIEIKSTPKSSIFLKIKLEGNGHVYFDTLEFMFGLSYDGKREWDRFFSLKNAAGNFKGVKISVFLDIGKSSDILEVDSNAFKQVHYEVIK